VHLTGEGKDLIVRVFPGVVATLVSAFSVLNAHEQHELAALCRRLGTAAS
jgi:hypothetical protein